MVNSIGTIWIWMIWIWVVNVTELLVAECRNPDRTIKVGCRAKRYIWVWVVYGYILAL